MKKALLLIVINLITLLAIPIVNIAQTPNLGTAANFVLFSSVGAVGNTGISQLTGNVGTNTGAVTGFGNVNGVMHNANAVTAQCAIDLQALWYQLDTTTVTATHLPVLGDGETLFEGVYSLAAAGSLVGILTLDAQGDSSAIFIIKTGGAFTTAAVSSVNLINGALPCNVFWKAEGAIGLAALTSMKGNLISHNGAIAVGDGCTIEGRALSTAGAVTVYGTVAQIPPGCGQPILTGPTVPSLNALNCFTLFSSDGLISNTGITSVSGDIGTNNGTTTGFNPFLVTGSLRPGPDDVTAQGAADLQNMEGALNSLVYDIELLYPAQFGNNLILTPHTYRMNAATTFTDTLYLNAQGNPDAIFVIRIIGALSTSTYSTVRLINGTQAKNVYWKVTGAVTINANSVFCGTIICDGAVVLNAGATIDGRVFTSAGAITTTTISANNSFGGYCAVLGIGLGSFTALCDKKSTILNWSTASSVANKNYFTIERSLEGITWQAIGTVDGAGTVYSYTDRFPGKTTTYYRLKTTDEGEHINYGKVISVKSCTDDPSERVAVYPNPSTGKFSLLYSGNKSEIYSTQLFNSMGEKMGEWAGAQYKFDLSGKPRGIYYLYIRLYSQTIVKKILIK